MPQETSFQTHMSSTRPPTPCFMASQWTRTVTKPAAEKDRCRVDTITANATRHHIKMQHITLFYGKLSGTQIHQRQTADSGLWQHACGRKEAFCHTYATTGTETGHQTKAASCNTGDKIHPCTDAKHRNANNRKGTTLPESTKKLSSR